jgi:hypothetical protein
MQFFKFVVAFLSVGGTSYALFGAREIPNWLKIVIVTLTIVTVVAFLPDLPKAIEGIREAGRLISKLLPDLHRPEPLRRSEPTPAPAPAATPPAPVITKPSTDAPSVTFAWPPASSAPTPPPKCVALVMSARGAWSTGSGSCSRLQDGLGKLRQRCAGMSGTPCEAWASSPKWVAGVVCRAPAGPGGWRGNSFPAHGGSEAEAFQRAFNAASMRGFPNVYCKRAVSQSADDQQARRY